MKTHHIITLDDSELLTIRLALERVTAQQRGEPTDLVLAAALARRLRDVK